MRLYADTSVFGGCFDTGFSEASRALFDRVCARKAIVVLSDVVLRELARAPESVRSILEELPDEQVQRAEVSDEVAVLTQEYIDSGVLTERWTDDAAHVAIATIARADAIVSWNFRHMVRLDRIRGFHAVNVRLGYPLISIMSPLEIMHADATD